MAPNHLVNPRPPRCPPPNNPPRRPWNGHPSSLALTNFRSVPPLAPPISAETNLKARAFDYFMAQVGPMSDQFSSSEIIASASEVFSLSTSAAHGLANDITEEVRATMFNANHLIPVGFFKRNGDAIDVDPDPAQCKDGITYFTVSVTIKPSKIHDCFREANSPSKTIEYTMRLPQTSSSSATVAPGGSDGGSGSTSADDDDPFSTPITARRLSSTFDATKSPRMAALITNLSDGSTGLTYRDQLDFLDHQREFTRIFGRKPHIFELRKRHPHVLEPGDHANLSHVKLEPLSYYYYDVVGSTLYEDTGGYFQTNMPPGFITVPQWCRWYRWQY